MITQIVESLFPAWQTQLDFALLILTCPPALAVVAVKEDRAAEGRFFFLFFFKSTKINF